MGIHIDSSCLQVDKALPPSTSEAQIKASLANIVMPFPSMILERLTSGREDASDECMGIGRPADEFENELVQVMVRSLMMTLDEDPDQLDARARGKLHHFTTASWITSHHRN